MPSLRSSARFPLRAIFAVASLLALAPTGVFAQNAGGAGGDSPEQARGFSSVVIPYDRFQKTGGYTLSDYLANWSNIYGPGEMAVNDTRTFTGGSFNIDAAPFQTAYDFSVFDHIKYLAVSNSTFTIPEVGSIQFQIDINAETPGTQPGRVINGTYIQSGAPYAAATLEGQQAGATLHMIDFGTGQLFDWFVSGHTAFTLIERLPSSVTGSPNYVGREKMYTQIIDEVPIASGWHTVAIRYNRDPQGDRAEYYLDGRLVSQVRNVGVPLDAQGVKYTGIYPSLGAGEPVRNLVGHVAIGHGLFSLLDAFPFQHPDAPELAVSIPVANRIFGQGARANFDNVVVTITDRMLKASSAYVSPTRFPIVPQPPVRQADLGGAGQVAGTPAGTQFSAVSPNPTPGQAGLEFSLQQASHVTLGVYDTQGRLVTTLVSGMLGAGSHHAAWDGSTPAGAAGSGVYFARLQVGDRSLVRRFALVR